MSEPQKPLSGLREIGQRNVRGPQSSSVGLIWAKPLFARLLPWPAYFLVLSATPGPSSLLYLPSYPHLGQPLCLPVLFCTSLLPGDRPTKNSPHSLSRPQLPKEQEMRGAGRPVPCPHPPTLNSEQCPALWPGASANLAISGSSHTPPWSVWGGCS